MKERQNRILRLAAMLLLGGCLSLQAQNVSFNNERVTLKKAFEKIESVSNYRIAYNATKLNVNQQVVLNQKDKTVPQIMDELLKGTDYTFEIKGHQIIIVPKRQTKSDARQKITGIVTDENGEGIIGASITEKGTGNGTVTDINGRYELTVPKGSTIQISYIGYLTQHIKVNKNQIDIRLTEDAHSLDEVVVVGYGQMKKSDLTGSVSSVAVDHDKAIYNSGIDHLLQGNAPGVYVNGGDSQLGGLVNVRIRGTSTLNGNKEPLYVIDGIIMNDATEDVGNPNSGGGTGSDPVQTTQSGLTGINPQDIQSIEVLKDASATAIYGSRASNGVVLITTKQGKSGKAKINLTTGISFDRASKHINVLNAEEYIAYRNEKEEDFYKADFHPENRDWQRELFHTAITQSYRLSANGGNDKANYYVAGGYLDNKGIIRNTGLSQADLRVNYQYKLNNNLALKGTFSMMRRVNDMTTGTDGQGNQRTSLTRHAVLAKPFANVDPEDDDDTGLQLTPTNWLTDYEDHSEENRTMASIALDYKIIKGLTFHLMGSYDNRDKTRSRWYSTGVYTGMKVNGQLGYSELRSLKKGLEALFYYDYTLNHVHHLSGTAGVTYERRDANRYGMLGEDFSILSLGIDGIGYANKTYTNSHSMTNETTASSLVRMNYNYLDRYLVTLTGRVDGSSKFQKGNRYSFFPSVALAWRVNQEQFLKDSQWLSNLKVRLGWGMTGNQSISAYATQNTYGNVEYSTGSGQNIVGLEPSKIANPDLKWEATTQVNAGIDFGAFNNRLTFSIDAYHKETNDILQSMNTAVSTGYSSIYVNCGSIQNNGIEVAVNAVPVSTKDFTWTIGANLSHNKNRITDLGLPLTKYGTEFYEAYYGTNLSYYASAAFPVNIFIKGKPIGLFWGYKTNGIFQSDEQANGLVYNGDALKAGDIAYVDTNEDGVINTEDRVILGDPNPDFTFGFNTSLTYKDFTLSAQFHGSVGNEVVNANKLDNTNTYYDYNILREAYFDAWRADKPSTTYPRIGVPLSELTDRLIEDGSFLRLGSLSLTWNVPVKPVKLINAMQLTLTGRNLFTITNYSGYNPDINSFSNDPKRIGIDYGSAPITRSYSCTLNVTF
ncbi:TonB-dependent receptor [Prevotella sp. lc2012]|uniref:TonB-dependent receptor n=1 Tax=Prevotella sp. lc2012 TaxID=1761886 RepID=UPI000895E088|nr:TonB-dependent receptor [Prevotella sp. lc2012]SEE41958.1 TonB-linked outer membrane protein, SusC/RagA family [Prevotella sp. lc2012]